jgi:mRNA interferase MazF
VSLDPIVGREIGKRRPAMVVSPDEMNRNLETIIMAPITSKIRSWPTRISIALQNKPRSIALDQTRTVSVMRLGKKITVIDPGPALAILRDMFA